MSSREKFSKWRKIITLFVRVFRFLPRFVSRVATYPTFNIDGSLGNVTRYVYYACKLGSVGDACYFARQIVFKNPSFIQLGSRVSIHEWCYIDGLGGVEIGDDVSIAHGCSILSSNHTWNDVSQPIKYNDVIPKRVVIENDVWIGCGVKIMPGSIIRSRTVIAAGAVVTGETQGGHIYAGVPAKAIKAL